MVLDLAVGIISFQLSIKAVLQVSKYVLYVYVHALSVKLWNCFISCVVQEPDKKYFKRGEAQKKEVEEILKKRTKQEAEGSVSMQQASKCVGCKIEIMCI